MTDKQLMKLVKKFTDGTVTKDELMLELTDPDDLHRFMQLYNAYLEDTRAPYGL